MKVCFHNPLGLRSAALALAALLIVFLPRITTATPDLTGASIGPNISRQGISFAQTSSGALASSYFKYDQKLYFLAYKNLAWTEELVESGVISLGSRNYSRLLFLNDRPHIVYHDSIHERLKHAWRSGSGSWYTEVIDSNGSVGAHLSAVDCGHQTICAAYYDSGNTSLKFAAGNAGAWAVNTIDSPGDDVGQFTAITLSRYGRPLISYYDATNSLPKIAERGLLGTWSIETLPAVAGYGRWTSILQDLDGTTHLSAGSYYDAQNSNSDGTLYYASKPEGGEWSVSDYSFSPMNVSAYTSISLQPSGKPQIAARHWLRSAVIGETADVFYTYLDGNFQWQRAYMSPDDFGPYFYSSISCLVDPWGAPQVAYYYSGYGVGKLEVHGAADADGDTLPDAEEGSYSALPHNADTDSDGLSDGYEVLYRGTNPHAADSDGDGIADSLDLDPLDGNAQNLVPDGSMDSPQLDHWDLLGTPDRISKELGEVVQGQRSLKIDGGGAYSGVEQSALSSSQATRYVLQLYYRRQAGNLRISVGWGSDTDFENSAFVDSDSSGWVTYQRVITTPAGAGDLRLMMETDGAAYLDSVELYASPGGATPIPQPTIEPSPTPTRTPTPTAPPPTPTPTFTPSPTETPTPTDTATPVATSTATSSPTVATSPTEVGTAPTSTPVPTATASPIRLFMTLLLGKNTSVRSALTGHVYRASGGKSPLSGASVELVCDKKAKGSRISNAGGAVQFTVARQTRGQRCYIHSGAARSATISVPKR